MRVKRSLLILLLGVVLYITYRRQDVVANILWETKLKTMLSDMREYAFNVSKEDDPRAGTNLSNLTQRKRLKPMKKVIPDVARRMKNRVVPKVVHSVWFYPVERCHLRFHVYLSLLSVHKFVKPDNIIVWNSTPPCGKWWERAQKEIPAMELKYMEAPTHVFGQEIKFPEHKADVARLRILIQHGGFYIDNDIVALQSWDPLLYYNTTLPAASPGNLANGFIASVKNSQFLQYWLEAYRHYNANNWGENSLFVPTKLAEIFPHLVHIEVDTIFRPSIIDPFKALIFGEGNLIDWSKNYGMHLYYRFHKKEHNPEDIKKINSTMGELFRYIYYGKRELI